MGRRKNTRPRCEICGLHRELCVCEYLPRVANRTHVLIVQNNHERNKPTNTARLLAAVLDRSTTVHYAVRGVVFDPTPLRAVGSARLLFPGEDAEVLSAKTPSPLETLVVVDGTWAQCSRMSRRVPELAAIPTAILPAGEPTRWAGVRTADDPARLSTFEATARALGLLEGDELRVQMIDFFERVAAGMLFMKGKLPSPEVPASWRSPVTRDAADELSGAK